MKRDEGRRGRATPVSEIALKRRGRKRKGLCLLCLKHWIKFTEHRSKRMVPSKCVQQEGSSWILILDMLRIQVLQVTLSLPSQPGKHVTGDGLTQEKAGSSSFPWCSVLRASGSRRKHQHICCLLASHTHLSRAQKTDPSYLVLLFHSQSRTSSNHPS